MQCKLTDQKVRLLLYNANFYLQLGLKLLKLKRKQALSSACFLAGAGLEPATFGL